MNFQNTNLESFEFETEVDKFSNQDASICSECGSNLELHEHAEHCSKCKSEFEPDEFEVDLDDLKLENERRRGKRSFRRPSRRRSRPVRRLSLRVNKRTPTKLRPSRPGKVPRPRPKRSHHKPGKRPIIIRPRRRRPLVIREPTAPCVCPAHGTEFVRWVQSSLNQILRLSLRINGVMNRATRNAVRDFQRQEGLPVDGIAGPETEKVLLGAKVKQPIQKNSPSANPESRGFELDFDPPNIIDLPSSYSGLEIIKKPSESGKGDSRKAVKKSKYKFPPYRYICQIEIVMPGDSVFLIGTGILVGPRSILTAAHVLFQPNSTNLKLANRIHVTPARRGDENFSFGSSFATKLVPNPRYTHFRQSGIRPKSILDAEDYGIIQLDRSLGIRVGYWGLKPRPIYDKRGTSISGGPLPFRAGVQKVNLCGYPTDKSGKFQWRAYDETVELSDRVLYYLNDTTPGMSGSPVWVKRSKWKGGRVLVGVHGGGGDPLDYGRQANRAAYCDNNMVKFIQKHSK